MRAAAVRPGRLRGRRNRRPRGVSRPTATRRRAATASAAPRTTTARCACCRATWLTSSSPRSRRSGRSSTSTTVPAVREQFLKRLAAEIERRGALDVLRNGIKDSGCKFQLAYFRPASGLNEETQRLHAANSSPSCASSATARRTRTASTSCCS